MKCLRDLFLDQLRDMYYAEDRIITMLPTLATVATCRELRSIINTHLRESEGHKEHLEQVFESFHQVAKGVLCEATVGLVKEAEKISSTYGASSAGNAAIICAMQKIEHYEIASYGCLREWAVMLGDLRSAALLKGILDQEKEANNQLSTLARAKSNHAALREAIPSLVSA